MCKTEGCGKKPSYGVAGTKTVEYCAQHAPDGMVNVKSMYLGLFAALYIHLYLYIYFSGFQVSSIGVHQVSYIGISRVYPIVVISPS